MVEGLECERIIIVHGSNFVAHGTWHILWHSFLIGCFKHKTHPCLFLQKKTAYLQCIYSVHTAYLQVITVYLRCTHGILKVCNWYTYLYQQCTYAVFIACLTV